MQIDILRKMSNGQRFALTRSLSNSVIRLSKRAIRRANPALSEEEVGNRFVELHYGEALAADLRRYLLSKK